MLKHKNTNGNSENETSENYISEKGKDKSEKENWEIMILDRGSPKRNSSEQ